MVSTACQLTCNEELLIMPVPGDPIECGAASAVFKGGAGAVCFTAAKSHMGHAEPAAGAVGILHVRAP